MKVLILSQRVPFPPNGGYPIVVYNTVKGLLQQGVKVSLFCLNSSKNYVDVEEIYDPIYDKIDFYQVSVDVEINFWDAFFNVFSNQSYNVERFFSEEAERALENLLREQEFDIIQFEGLFVVPYLEAVKSFSNAKLIYRAHHIEHNIWNRLSLREHFTPKRLYLKFLSRRLEAYETEQINRFHQVFTISEPDRQKILMMGCLSKLDVFPVALDLEKYKISPPKSELTTLFYIGAMDWRPNKEGLEWFIEEIWPDIEKLSGDLRFYVAGKYMPKQFYEYDYENIIVEGEVFDVIEFMDSKSIMIVPLLSGSGMRVRIIEGMAMKKCIIATTMAAEGINYTNGKDILIANTADEFYQLILKCVIHPKRRLEIGENARKVVEKYHDINESSKRMFKAYKDLIKNKA